MRRAVIVVGDLCVAVRAREKWALWARGLKLDRKLNWVGDTF